MSSSFSFLSLSADSFLTCLMNFIEIFSSHAVKLMRTSNNVVLKKINKKTRISIEIFFLYRIEVKAKPRLNSKLINVVL